MMNPNRWYNKIRYYRRNKQLRGQLLALVAQSKNEKWSGVQLGKMVEITILPYDPCKVPTDIHDLAAEIVLNHVRFI